VALTLINQLRGHASLPAGATTWKTCMREVSFVDSVPGAPQNLEGALRDEHAYAVLVEIVSGLRSPLIGETEVQAQFKAFLDALDPVTHGWLRRLGQHVLGDVKRIRTRHLQHVGAHSYGRLAARHVTARHVAVIGAGALARDVVTVLDQHTHADVWRRRPDVETASWTHGCHLDLFLIADAQTETIRRTPPTTVVIAAPVSAGDLLAILACYPHVTEVIDLRAEDESTPLDRPVPRFTLADLLADAEARTLTGVASVIAARREIRNLAQAYARREELHPSGWDDLCA
jgi:glutamyl-tRNA reductase